VQNQHFVACSVLVPVLNEQAQIESTVSAMAAQEFPGEVEFLFVDGGSTDGTFETLARLAERDERIRLFSNPGGNTAGNLNVALGHARGRWVARMDAHTRYPSTYLRDGVERLQAGGTPWVSGLAVPRGHNALSRAVALALGSPLGRGGSRKWAATAGGGAEYELDSGVFGGAWERGTLLEYGGWDENWPRNQDSEMAGRFLASGQRLVLLSSMAAEYVPRDRLRALARQYFDYGRYRTRTAARHPATMRRSHLLAPGVVASAGTAVAGPWRPLRRLARAGLVAYGVVIAAATAKSRGGARTPAEAALVAPVLITMHFAHGAGAWSEAVRGRLPAAALASVLGLKSLSRMLSPAPQEVWAPSLDAALAAAAARASAPETEDLAEGEQQDPQVEAK
jgi:succinoglycan biosynthesis protein ExoA